MKLIPRLLALRAPVVGLLMGVHCLSSSFAKTREPPQDALDGRLRWGRCFLSQENMGAGPSQGVLAHTWPVLCLKPKVSGQVVFRDDRSDKSLGWAGAKLYHGLHLNEYFSVHGNYMARRLHYIGRESERVEDDARVESLFAQVGNVAVSRWRLSAGKIKAPFGVDYRPLMEVYDEFLKTRKYWRSPRWGARMTMDTQVSSQFDLGYSTDKLNKDTHVERGGEDSSNESVSLRSMFDIAALDGFRFVFSGYGDRYGERRLGIGFINISRRLDETVFEWVRSRPQPSGDFGFDQIFRLGYRGAPRHGNRWVAEFESERADYRMFNLGFDFFLPDYVILRLTLGYHSGWFAHQDNFMIFGSALQVTL